MERRRGSNFSLLPNSVLVSSIMRAITLGPSTQTPDGTCKWPHALSHRLRLPLRLTQRPRIQTTPCQPQHQPHGQSSSRISPSSAPARPHTASSSHVSFPKPLPPPRLLPPRPPRPVTGAGASSPSDPSPNDCSGLQLTENGSRTRVLPLEDTAAALYSTAPTRTPARCAFCRPWPSLVFRNRTAGSGKRRGMRFRMNRFSKMSCEGGRRSRLNELMQQWWFLGSLA